MTSVTREEGPDGNLNAGMGDEFMVAADLTLYGNPLRCLTTRKKKKDVKPEPSTETTDKKTDKASTPESKKLLREEELKQDLKRSNQQIATNALQQKPEHVDASVDTIAADLTKYHSPLDEKI